MSHVLYTDSYYLYFTVVFILTPGSQDKANGIIWVVVQKGWENSGLPENFRQNWFFNNTVTESVFVQ
jgi:hypothetical protein